jgi:hypothetical protein
MRCWQQVTAERLVPADRCAASGPVDGVGWSATGNFQAASSQLQCQYTGQVSTWWQGMSGRVWGNELRTTLPCCLS